MSNKWKLIVSFLFFLMIIVGIVCIWQLIPEHDNPTQVMEYDHNDVHACERNEVYMAIQDMESSEEFQSADREGRLDMAEALLHELASYGTTDYPYPLVDTESIQRRDIDVIYDFVVSDGLPEHSIRVDR